MGHAREKLKALVVERLSRKPGLHGDGGGLYLRVSSPTSASWVFRYMVDHKAHEMGLGKYPDVSLGRAREKAAEARALKANGHDPIMARNATKLAKRLEIEKAITFKQCAAAFIEAHRAGWRTDKHAGLWEGSLSRYVEPVIGDLVAQEIGTDDVLKVLKPIWTEKPETASRVRGRIEAVLDWAKAHGYRDGENPARWRGHLDKLLPPKGKVRRVKHHAALPFNELPAFMAALRAQENISARALELAILTAARTGEVLGARWDEMNLTENLWTIAGARMKAGKEHRVPLAKRSVAILEEMKAEKVAGDAFVFSGRGGKPLSNMALLMQLRRMGRADITAHGFRSTFRDWAAERTNYPGEVVEMALAHSVGNKVEAAYRRGDLFERRRALAEDWSIACTGGDHV